MTLDSVHDSNSAQGHVDIHQGFDPLSYSLKPLKSMHYLRKCSKWTALFFNV